MSFIKENNNDVLIVSFGGMGRYQASPSKAQIVPDQPKIYPRHSYLYLNNISRRPNIVSRRLADNPFKRANVVPNTNPRRNFIFGRPAITYNQNQPTPDNKGQEQKTEIIENIDNTEKKNDSVLFDFFNFLPNNFKNVDLHFYGDPDQCCYHKGIKGLSTNIDDTVEYLKQKIGNRYKKVIFIGLSGGGYGAILFGSLLNVDHVITFFPLTQLVKNRPEYESRYKDLLPHINNTTQYHLFGVSKPRQECHSLQQCKRICVSENVILKVHDITEDIKKLMRDCNIVDLLNKLINENSDKIKENSSEILN